MAIESVPGIPLRSESPPSRITDQVPRIAPDAPSGRLVQESDPMFVQVVREAAAAAYAAAVGQPTHEVYAVLAAELKQRGVYPEPEAVIKAAMLISRGKKPAVLRGQG